jgi:hypothetical protein
MRYRNYSQKEPGAQLDHFLSISSMMYAACRIAVSTVATFFGLGLSGFSNSASLRADRIVAAIRIANFLSSDMGDSERMCGGRRGTQYNRLYF